MGPQQRIGSPGATQDQNSPQMVQLKRQVEGLLTEAGRVKVTQKVGEAPEEE